MKRDPNQLSLFPPRSALASRPFSLEPSPGEIRMCSRCGRQIITQQRTAEGTIVSEFISVAGACWNCAHPTR